jgi:predicted chitinase
MVNHPTTVFIKMILRLILNSFLISFITAQSRSNMTESGQVNRLIFDSVAASPAFISRTQFVEAWHAAVPYLPKPANVTQLNVIEYPYFMNTAVMIGKINNATQLAMYFSQILYETNGLSISQIMPCSRLGSETACSDYVTNRVNNTGAYCGCMDYRGRGRLLIEDADTYKSASNALFGKDIIFEHPDHVQKYPQVAWATAAWNWATNVGALIGSSDAFGLTTKFLRPNDCYSSTMASDESSTAFNIYQQVLSIFDPDRVANPAGCVPNRK